MNWMIFFKEDVTSPTENLFQSRESNPKKPPSGTSSSIADPVSTIQAKADTFDGLDPLSMFAAQEASAIKLPAAAPVAKQERVGWIGVKINNFCYHDLLNPNPKELFEEAS